jgi:hypothetical protein
LWRKRGTAGHVEEAVIAVLHVLKHVEQQVFPVPCGLVLFACFAFTLHGGLCVHLGCFELLTQHIALQAQHVALLLRCTQCVDIYWRCVVLRISVAWRCVMERDIRGLLRATL